MATGAELLTTAAAAILGTIVGPYLSSGRERRAARVAVIEAMGNVDTLRWAFAGDYEAFKRAVLGLETAGLMAATSRPALDRYVYAATVARRVSQVHLEEDYPEYAGSIPSELGDVVRDAGALLTDHSWHPVRARLAHPRRDRRLHMRLDAVKAELAASGRVTEYQWRVG